MRSGMEIDRLRKTQSLGPARFVERKSRPIVRVGTTAALERVLMLIGAQDPDRSISASAGSPAHNNIAKPRLTLLRVILLQIISISLHYQIAEHAVGFHFASLDSFLNWELMIKGWRKYMGSVVTMVTTINGSPLGSLIKSKYSVRLALSL